MNLTSGLWIAIAADIIIFGTSIYWAYTTDLIKDSQINTATMQRPYSLSRAQLLWWVNVVAICAIFLFAKEQTFPLLNSTALILLGISAGTTVSGRIIDNNKVQNDLKKGLTASLNATKDNFVNDILSDENGISVQRFQGLIFNVILGVFFMVKFFTDFKMPDFGTQELALLGVSSSTYIASKINENT